jgi:hypothetical protein
MEDRMAVQEGICDAILSDNRPAGTPPPAMEGAALSRSGAIHLACADQVTAEWAKQVVSRLPLAGQAGNTTYRVVAPWERPSVRSFVAWIPIRGIEKDPKRAETLLRKQNPEFAEPGALRVREAVGAPRSTGCAFRLEIRENLLELLAKKQHSLACGMQRITLKGKISDPAGETAKEGGS